ncbi:MAG: C4-dicarboxylate TRAP transporter substrate-binding protein [Marinosulfonomonas sp.]|nr:C4-dicarboxylate TRAP transporter substrate-binding protein [Marinosulfonomonas sp.]
MNTFKIAGIVGTMIALAAPVQAETFNFTIVAGHPPLTKGVAGIRDFFIPEVTKRLAADGKHTINWTEAYAGSVADYRGVLEAVESGLGEFGYVPHLFEGDKLPLEQITYITPFGTSDLRTMLGVIEKLHEEIPAIGESWAKNNQMVLATIGIDDYHFVTKEPISGPDDLADRKIGTAGLAVNWLRGSNAVPITGALPTFYNSMSTGLIDGVMTFESAVAPYKFFEVAPHVTKISFGAKYGSALTVNLDTWASLPDEVKAVIKDVAKEYRAITAAAYFAAGEASLEIAKAAGATVTAFTQEQRKAFAAKMPNIAMEWAEKLDAQGIPGTETLNAYMRLSKEAGIEFARDWSVK